MFQVSETITSGETAKPSWILMRKEKSASYCLTLKKNKAVEQAAAKVSYPQKLKFLLLVHAPAVPLFERK